MQWVMRSRSFVVALAIALWWVLVNLPWLTVGKASFTGAQLLPALNLFPVIALTALFISMYGKFRRTLLLMACAVLAFGLFATLTTDLSLSAVAIAELQRLSGILNPQSHDAGVAMGEVWGKYVAFAANVFAIFTTLWSLGGSTNRSQIKLAEPQQHDNRSLWDEQN